MKKLAATLALVLALVIGFSFTVYASDLDHYAMADAVQVVVNTVQVYKSEGGDVDKAKLTEIVMPVCRQSQAIAYYKQTGDAIDAKNYIAGLVGVAYFTWQMMESGQATPEWVLAHPAQVVELILAQHM